MRHFLFRSIGLLELAASIVLVVFAWQLPGSAEVEDTTARIDTVGKNASRQITTLREQCARLRKRQPELLALSVRLEKQMRLVGKNIDGHALNADGLTSVSDALGQIAEGLDGLGTTLDGKSVAQIGKGLGTTAEFLDGKIAPAADRAAAAIEKAASGLKADAGKLSALLKETPLELKGTRAMVESLEKFEEGLERMAKVARLDNFETMREGFKGLEESLDTGATQVEKMAKYTIPKVTVKGLRLEVEDKPFWPDGKTIAEGMRKGAKGCQAAAKEMDGINKELPKVRASLEQSRKVVSSTRLALSGALSRQEQIEPVLKRMPQHLARLTDELPQLTLELAKVLRETSRLKEVATALREAEKGIGTASARWPELRTSLGKTATLMRTTQKQLKRALTHRDDYESMLRQTVSLTTMFAEALPLLLRQMESGLEQQETSLGDLGESIDKVNEALPGMAASASRILTTTRVLLGLVALLVGVHASYLLVGGRFRDG